MEAGISSNRERSSRQPMSSDEWRALFLGFRETLFRLETLPSYESESEKATIQAFLSGADPSPADTNSAKYHAEIKATIASGKSIERLHVVPDILTDYLKWEIFWSYRHLANVGAKVYLLEASRHSDLAKEASELYLVDNQHLIHVEYDSKGAFRALSRDTDRSMVNKAVELRKKLLVHATPLEEYMRAHR